MSLEEDTEAGDVRPRGPRARRWAEDEEEDGDEERDEDGQDHLPIPGQGDPLEDHNERDSSSGKVIQRHLEQLEGEFPPGSDYPTIDQIRQFLGNIVEDPAFPRYTVTRDDMRVLWRTPMFLLRAFVLDTEPHAGIKRRLSLAFAAPKGERCFRQFHGGSSNWPRRVDEGPMHLLQGDCAARRVGTSSVGQLGVSQPP